MGSAKVERNLQGWPCPRNVTVFAGYLSSVVVLWLEKGFFFFFWHVCELIPFTLHHLKCNVLHSGFPFVLFSVVAFGGGCLKAFGLNNEEDLWNLTTDYFLHDPLKLTYLVICHYLLRSKKKKEKGKLNKTDKNIFSLRITTISIFSHFLQCMCIYLSPSSWR